jgi:hypothetical protein
LHRQISFQGIRELQSLVGDRLKTGILLYAGKEILPFGAGLWAMPFQALWSARPQADAHGFERG